MPKPLTAAAVAKWKPHHYKRLENPDAACPGLYFVVEPSGAKSYYSRFRRPNGEPARLKLGSCDVTGKESEGEPVIGGHLTLAAARRLNTEVRRQLALGRDPAAD